MKKLFYKSFLGLPLAFLAVSAVGQVQVQLQQVFSAHTYVEPTEMTHAGDSSGRMFVAYKRGIVRIFKPSDPAGNNPAIFLNISNKTVSSSEMGLLGLAFHPKFKENGYVYVNYIAQSPTRTVISRFHVSPNNPDKADSTTEQILLTFSQPYTNHKGGKLVFGPDGYLYISTGDGGSANDPQANAQNLGTYLGKILRIDVDSTVGTRHYGIPADNPFWSVPSAKKEIYAYGLRNPWRFSYDKVANRFWIADVGQNAIEEVDTLIKGGNYGWRILEGTRCTGNTPAALCQDTTLIKPIYEYPHAGSNNLSITGGYVYRGPSAPTLYGKYIFGDYNSGRVWSLALRPDSAPLVTMIAVSGSLGTFGLDENNDLYTLNHSTGAIYKVRDNTTSVKNKDLLKDVAIRVLPMPARSEIIVYVKNASSCGTAIEIRDLEGKIIKKATLQLPDNAQEEAKVKLSVSDMAVGTYVVSQSCGGVANSTKFIIAR